VHYKRCVNDKFSGTTQIFQKEKIPDIFLTILEFTDFPRFPCFPEKVVTLFQANLSTPPTTSVYRQTSQANLTSVLAFT